MATRSKDGGRHAAKRKTGKKPELRLVQYMNPRQRTEARMRRVLAFFNSREDCPLDIAQVSAHCDGCTPGRQDHELPAMWFAVRSQLCLNGDCSHQTYDPTLGEAVVAWVRRLVAQLSASADALERHMKEQPNRWGELLDNKEFREQYGWKDEDWESGRVSFAPDAVYEERCAALGIKPNGEPIQ